MKLNIRNKLFLGFGSLIFSFLLFGFFVNSLLDEYNSDITTFSKEKDDVFAAYHIANKITNLWQYFTDAALTLDEKVIEDEIDPIHNSLKTDLEELVRATSSQELKTIKDDLENFYLTGRKMFNAYRTSKQSGDMVMEEFDRISGKYISLIDSYVETQKAELENSFLEIKDMGSSGQSKVKLFILIAFLIAIAVSYFISRNLTVPLKKLESAMSSVSEGDLSINCEVKNEDEIGHLASMFNGMVQNIKDMMEQVEEQSSLALKAKEEAESVKARIQEEQAYLERSTEQLISEMSKLANGDLSAHVTPEREGDSIDQLYQSFNATVENIRETILKISESVEALASASTQISSSAEELATGTQEQSMQTNEISAGVEEMASTVIENSRNIQNSTSTAKKAGEIAKNGGEVVKNTVKMIEEINETVKSAVSKVSGLSSSTQEIGEIIQVIEEIADQTNLLALNAAIEAARAGEEGRGFAVVADEVRKLAERTTKATKEIADKINHIQKISGDVVVAIEQGAEKSDEGKSSALQAGKALEEIIVTNDNVINDITAIAAASEQQSATAEQIAKNITQINSVVHESASGVEEIAKASMDLDRLAVNLQEMIRKFNIGPGVHSANYEQTLMN